MEEKVEVITLVDEDGEADLWFGTEDQDTPRRLVEYIKDNCERDHVYKIKIEMVSKSDFDKEY